MINRQLTKITILLCFFISGIANSIVAQETTYERKDDNSVWMEINPNTKNPRRFTEDNLVYQAGLVDTFTFHYFNPSGKECYMKFDPIQQTKIDRIHNGDTSFYTTYIPSYKLIDTFRTDSCIHLYTMKVHPDQKGFGPNYNQTVVEFNMLLNGESKAISFTGIVDNPHNIWLHPNRDCLLRILELNPFPYIQFPIKRGKKWEWHLSIGSQWGDQQWKTWEGKIENHYQYKIIKTDQDVKTPMGVLPCAVIKSTAKSELGKTALTAYYNEKYGFVRMEYVNIDGSRIIIDLVGTQSNVSTPTLYH